jgi:sigma-E factor negative regulatory protein RseB
MLRQPKHTVVAAVVLTLAVADVWAEDVRSWLDRMNRAVEELNYEGTFVHVLGSSAELLHIVHRNENGQIGERIVSLDGIGREIIRHGDELQCILPDQRVVLLEQRQGAGQFASSLPTYSEELEPYYELVLYRTARVADRETQVVGIKPRDQYRYGYVLWLDRETALPLKSQLRDERDGIVEQILFTQIQIVDYIPESALEPATDTEGFTFHRPPPMTVQPAGAVSWRAARLPGGFKLSVARQSPLAGSEYPVDHLVYSDGLATVSVFIEDPKTNMELEEGFSRVGSTNAFSLTVRGRKVTAVGGVPRQTVRTIAASLTNE